MLQFQEAENVIKKEAAKTLISKVLLIEKQRMWNKKESDTSNNRGNWNHLKNLQKKTWATLRERTESRKYKRKKQPYFLYFLKKFIAQN